MDEPMHHVVRVGATFDRLSIPWVLGGSMASSIVGEPRSTNDVDIAVVAPPHRVRDLVDAVADTYFASVDGLIEAAETFSSFNILHRTTMFKIDLFFLGDNLLDRLQIERRRQIPVPGSTHSVWVTSAPDIILRKLWWYRLGREVSERQWNDVLTVLRVNNRTLDTAALRADAQALDLEDLLDRALAQEPHQRS